MTSLMDIVKGRRSIRKFEEKEVPDNLVTEVLEAVQWSPSWANTQCWEVIVVRDQALKDQLGETVSKGNPATRAVTTAPVVLVLCGKLMSSGYYNNVVTTKFGDWFMFDLGLAAQNLCLAAHNLGLGTVIVGLMDHDRAKDALKVPDGYEVVAMVPMGYPAKSPTAPKRRDVQEFTHYERF